jgi:hypothetical protein
MKKGALVIDDISHYEMEKLIEIYKPDIIGSGIKDKYVVEKMGVPCKQLHSYDYGGPTPASPARSTSTGDRPHGQQRSGSYVVPALGRTANRAETKGSRPSPEIGATTT